MPVFDDPALMVGFDTSDDAAVYRLDEKNALIQTVDIFPPVVDDPYDYGQIAAANALSDVYAMGGSPLLALNICCFPEELSEDVIREIMRGGYEKVREAGAVIAGGHTIKDREPKYGLSVTGIAEPSGVLINSGVRPGDALVLTKGLGTGILTTAVKAEMAGEEECRLMTESMSRLNRYAAESMKNFHVNGCTDITGFGLLGHALEMANGSGVSIRVDHASVPLLSGALEMAELGMIPAGAYRNREYLSEEIFVDKYVPLSIEDVLYDPQTSGGLLISVPEKQGERLAAQLREDGEKAAVIGYVEEKQEFSIVVV